MKKENCFNFGKKISASIVAVALVFSTATVLPSFAAKETTDLSQLNATGCLPTSKEVMEQHSASDVQIYDLEFVQADDSATQDALIGICKAAKVASLPEKTELNHKYLPPVDSQGVQGSCSAWATNYYMKSYMEAEEHDWDLSDGNKKHIFSPAFTYNQITHYEKNSDGTYNYNTGGTTIDENLDIIIEQGACPFYNLSYNQYDGTTKPNDSQKDMASNYKGVENPNTGNWHALHDIDSIKAYLAKGQPVVVSMDTSNEYHSLSKKDPVLYKPTISEDKWNKLSESERDNYYCKTGSHALCLVGYDENYNHNGETVPVFKFVNSWGKWWGENGYAYVTEDAFKSFGNNYIWAYVIDDKSHDDTNDFFTSKPEYVKITSDVRAYSSPDYFEASTDKDNYEYTIYKGSIIKISDFVSCKKSGQQPYFINEDGYYINAQKDHMTEYDAGSGEVIINGDKNNSVYNYNNSESSRITITLNSNEKFNNHNTLKIDYNVNQNDSYNGYAGAKINLDKTFNVGGAKTISFNYMTPANQNGTIALCLQGCVSKKIIELPTTNGEWKTFSGEYNFNNSNISDIEIYINGNESNCKTTPANGTIYLAEVSVGSNSVNIPTYQFNVSGDDNCTIEGTQSGNYKSGSCISVTANVKDGYKFIGWSEYKGGSIISTDKTYKFGIDKNVTLYANVSQQKFYTFKLINNFDGGIVGGKDGTYEEGESIYVNASAKLGYQFKGWSKTENGEIISNSIYYSFKIYEDTTLYANFIKLDTRHISVSCSTGRGSVIVTGGGIPPTGINSEGLDIPTGSEITLVAMPKEGCSVAGWYDNAEFKGEPLSTGNSYSLTVENDIDLYVKFKKDGATDYKLKVDCDEGGTTSGATTGEYEDNSYIFVAAYADDGYEFAGWSEYKGGPIIHDRYTYDFRISKDTTLYANFKKVPEYTINLIKTTGCSKVYMTYNNSDTATVKENTTIDAFAYAQKGYTFKGWYDNASFSGNPVSTSSHYTFSVTSNQNLYPKFEKDEVEQKYTVKFISNEGGSVEGATTRTVDAGTYMTVSYSVNDGYRFKGWSLSQGGEYVSTYNPYSFTVNSDMTIYLTFEKIPDYTVNVVKTTGCSKAYITATNSNSCTVREDTTIDIFANGESGYTFKGWYDNASFNGSPISTSSHYTFQVTSNLTLYPKFEKNSETYFNVVFKSSEGMVKSSLGTMYIQGSISGSCAEGTKVTVTATPNNNYQFVGWCDESFDGPVLSTSTTYTFTVNGATHIYAKFAEKTVVDDSNILVKGVSNSISDWTNANSGSYLNITSGSSDYLYNGAKTLKLDYNINTYDQYGGYAGRTVSLESTYKNDSSKGYNGVGFWYLTPAGFDGQIALCLQSQSAGLDDLVQLPNTNGEWKYYFYETNKVNISDLTLYINGSKNGYTTTASNGVAKGTLYMADIKLDKK